MKKKSEKIKNEQLEQLLANNEYPNNSFNIQIFYEYALKKVKLNWNDILFGICNRYFEIDVAIEFARDQLEKISNESLVFELAILEPNKITRKELINKFLCNLADDVPKSQRENTKDKMMYVVLCGLFEEKELFEEPIMVIQTIYEDFEFPDSLSYIARHLYSDWSAEIIYKEIRKFLYKEKQKY